MENLAYLYASAIFKHTQVYTVSTSAKKLCVCLHTYAHAHMKNVFLINAVFLIKIIIML
jgi:hypothetical protein